MSVPSSSGSVSESDAEDSADSGLLRRRPLRALLPRRGAGVFERLRLGEARLGEARLGEARLREVLLGEARLRDVRFGEARRRGGEALRFRAGDFRLCFMRSAAILARFLSAIISAARFFASATVPGELDFRRVGIVAGVADGALCDP
jgi:uncharacterized protein YjbI with pentapeptide repeats